MAETVTMPKLGFDMAEGTLVRWVKKPGEPIQKGEILAEIETDKATVEVESSASGILRELLVEEGSVVPVNTPIAIIASAGEKIEAPKKPQAQKQTDSPAPVEKEPRQLPEVPPQGQEKRGQETLKASPLARRIARENAIDLGGIKGSGPGGRIVRQDVEAALAGAGPAAVVRAETVPALLPTKADEQIGLSRLRQAIGRRMSEAKTTIPHFYVTREFKMDTLLQLREQFNCIVPEEEKLSVNDFLIKASALALRQFPNLNASLQEKAVRQHGQVNIGVAVSVEGGLLTVVCREADAKPLRQIAQELRSMAMRARQGKVRPEEIESSTFSISNLGMFGVDEFAAIINPPEAAILAVGAARQVAVVEEAVIKVGWRMKATLSVDHRISDGAEAAKFLQALAHILEEEPLRLIL